MAMTFDAGLALAFFLGVAVFSVRLDNGRGLGGQLVARDSHRIAQTQRRADGWRHETGQQQASEQGTSQVLQPCRHGTHRDAL
jgi:hypothetical protein